MFCSCRTTPSRLLLENLARLSLSEAAVTRTPVLHRTRRATALATRAWSSSVRRCEASKTHDSHEATLRDDSRAAPSGTTASAGPAPSDTPTDPAGLLPSQRAGRSKKNRKRGEKRQTVYLQGSSDALKSPREPWMAHKEALREKFPEGWQPLKRLSPDAIAGIRALHAQFPEEYTTPALARQFQVSPEAIRRILKSKWTPSADEEEKRQERWFRRGMSVWSRYAELGMKPPQKWRAEGITRDPNWHERRQAVIARRREEEQQQQGGGRSRMPLRLGSRIM